MACHTPRIRGNAITHPQSHSKKRAVSGVKYGCAQEAHTGVLKQVSINRPSAFKKHQL